MPSSWGVTPLTTPLVLTALFHFPPSAVCLNIKYRLAGLSAWRGWFKEVACLSAPWCGAFSRIAFICQEKLRGVVLVTISFYLCIRPVLYIYPKHVYVSVYICMYCIYPSISVLRWWIISVRQPSGKCFTNAACQKGGDHPPEVSITPTRAGPPQLPPSFYLAISGGANEPGRGGGEERHT